jgi:hypothetical protein
MKQKLDENEIVGNFYNFAISRKTLNEFAGMSKSMDDNEVIDKPDVVDRPNTDVNDLGDARKELLRIMKLAGQGDTEKKPAGWNLVLYDDPVTPGEAVIEGLRSVMNFGDGDIARVLRDIVQNQQSVLGVYAIEDRALKLRDALKRFVDNNNRYIGGDGTRGPWDLQVEVLKAGD